MQFVLLIGFSWELSNMLCHVQVNFLSQIRLSQKGDGPKVAKRLIDVYFALFKVCVGFYLITRFILYGCISCVIVDVTNYMDEV